MHPRRKRLLVNLAVQRDAQRAGSFQEAEKLDFVVRRADDAEGAARLLRFIIRRVGVLAAVEPVDRVPLDLRRLAGLEVAGIVGGQVVERPARTGGGGDFGAFGVVAPGHELDPARVVVDRGLPHRAEEFGVVRLPGHSGARAAVLRPDRRHEHLPVPVRFAQRLPPPAELFVERAGAPVKKAPAQFAVVLQILPPALEAGHEDDVDAVAFQLSEPFFPPLRRLGVCVVAVEARVAGDLQQRGNHPFGMFRKFGGHIRHDQDFEAFAVFVDLLHQRQQPLPVRTGGGQDVVGKAVHAGFGGHADLVIDVELVPVRHQPRQTRERALVDEASVGTMDAVFAVGGEIALRIIITVGIAVVDGNGELRKVVGEHLALHLAQFLGGAAVEGPLRGRLCGERSGGERQQGGEQKSFHIGPFRRKW